MRRIEVVDYSNNWPALFKAEKTLIENSIPCKPMQIFHIGSTAVPGLAAKPIIDILITVDNIADLDSFSAEFHKISYTNKGEFGISGRRYFQKGGELRSHQLHAFDRTAERVVKYLAFKEYLIAHPDIAQQYATLKLESALKFADNIDGYSSSKQDFIDHHERLAVGWYTTRIGLKQ